MNVILSLLGVRKISLNDLIGCQNQILKKSVDRSVRSFIRKSVYN